MERRDFIKLVGAAGLATTINPISLVASGTPTHKIYNGKGVTLFHPENGYLPISDHPISGNALYGTVKWLWKDDPQPYHENNWKFPMLAITSEQGVFINGWRLTEDSIPNIIGYGFSERLDDGFNGGIETETNQHMSITFLGNYDECNGLWVQVDDKQYFPTRFEKYLTYWDKYRNIEKFSAGDVLHVTIPLSEEDIYIHNSNSGNFYNMNIFLNIEKFSTRGYATVIIPD